jgi:hypothetical protein
MAGESREGKPEGVGNIQIPTSKLQRNTKLQKPNAKEIPNTNLVNIERAARTE